MPVASPRVRPLRSIRTISLAVLVACFLTACGGGGEPEPGAADTGLGGDPLASDDGEETAPYDAPEGSAEEGTDDYTYGPADEDDGTDPYATEPAAEPNRGPGSDPYANQPEQNGGFSFSTDPQEESPSPAGPGAITGGAGAGPAGGPPTGGANEQGFNNRQPPLTGGPTAGSPDAFGPMSTQNQPGPGSASAGQPSAAGGDPSAFSPAQPAEPAPGQSAAIGGNQGTSPAGGQASASAEPANPDSQLFNTQSEGPQPTTSSPPTAQNQNPTTSPDSGAPASGPARTYTIQPSDTFSSIAREMYGDPSQWVVIAQANPLVDPNRLSVGQEIRVPDLQEFQRQRERQLDQLRQSVNNPPAGQGGAADRTVTVRPGDTLSALARRVYGDARYWRLIFEANTDQLYRADDLYVGMELNIPPKPQQEAGGTNP